MLSIVLSLLRLVLWPNIWSLLENILCVLDKDVYFAAIGCNVLYMSVRSILSIMLFESVTSFIPLPVWSIHYWIWGLRSALINIAVCFSLQFCLYMLYIFRCFNVGCIYIYNCHVILMNWLLSLYNDLLCLIWQSLQFLTENLFCLI